MTWSVTHQQRAAYCLPPPRRLKFRSTPRDALPAAAPWPFPPTICAIAAICFSVVPRSRPQGSRLLDQQTSQLWAASDLASPVLSLFVPQPRVRLAGNKCSLIELSVRMWIGHELRSVRAVHPHASASHARSDDHIAVHPRSLPEHRPHGALDGP